MPARRPSVNDLLVGAVLLEARGDRCARAGYAILLAAASSYGRPGDRTALADAEIEELRPTIPLQGPGHQGGIWVDRPARFGWYERCFRAQPAGGSDGSPVHGTFATAAAELPRIAGMGFDVVYLPPIPIGKVHRRVATTRPPPHRQTWDRRERSVALMRAVTDTVDPGHHRRLRRLRLRGTRSGHGGSRWTWRCAHRIIRW